MRIKFILTASMILAVFHEGIALAGWQITASQEVHGGAIQSTNPPIVSISTNAMRFDRGADQTILVLPAAMAQVTMDRRQKTCRWDAIQEPTNFPAKPVDD